MAENILEDLFTEVLDWPLADLNNQLGYVDLVLTSQGVKYLIVEVKHPGALAWNRRAVEAALGQARRYAAEQKVRQVAICDGHLLYAAQLLHGGLGDRVFVSLESAQPDAQLWWLSVHGIYRPRWSAEEAALKLLPEREAEACALAEPASDALLHPKYKLPAECFAYVASAAKPATWKLPYRLEDGSIDLRRLPKAVQAILSNYRGVKVSGIPEKDIPDVLVRLACAAASLGKMPGQAAAHGCEVVQRMPCDSFAVAETRKSSTGEDEIGFACHAQIPSAVTEGKNDVSRSSQPAYHGTLAAPRPTDGTVTVAVVKLESEAGLGGTTQLAGVHGRRGKLLAAAYGLDPLAKARTDDCGATTHVQEPVQELTQAPTQHGRLGELAQDLLARDLQQADCLVERPNLR